MSPQRHDEAGKKACQNSCRITHAKQFPNTRTSYHLFSVKIRQRPNPGASDLKMSESETPFWKCYESFTDANK